MESIPTTLYVFLWIFAIMGLLLSLGAIAASVAFYLVWQSIPRWARRLVINAAKHGSKPDVA